MKTIAITTSAASGWRLAWLLQAPHRLAFAAASLVLALSAYHGLLVVWTNDFAMDRNKRSARFYRIANEIPTVLMILIVILAVVRPF